MSLTTLLTQLAPAENGWWVAKYIALLYGGRYLVLAALLFAAASVRWGRPNQQRPTPLKAAQVWRELGWSALTVAMFALVNLVLSGYGIIQHSLLYWRIADYGWLWFWLSIPALLALHDTLFYWLHRAMHHRLLFRRTHFVHHQSVSPSAWAAYSFHPWEALFEALIVTLIIFVIPVHLTALVVFQTISTLINVYGHCSREFYPENWHRHWLGRWINTSSTHSHHHATGRHNYGLYFLFWDRWMNTLAPEHDDRLDMPTEDKPSLAT